MSLRRPEVGEIIHKDLSLVPLEVLDVEQVYVLPRILVRSKWTRRVFEVESYEIRELRPYKPAVWGDR